MKRIKVKMVSEETQAPETTCDHCHHYRCGNVFKGKKEGSDWAVSCEATKTKVLADTKACPQFETAQTFYCPKYGQWMTHFMCLHRVDNYHDGIMRKIYKYCPCNIYTDKVKPIKHLIKDNLSTNPKKRENAYLARKKKPKTKRLRLEPGTSEGAKIKKKKPKTRTSRIKIKPVPTDFVDKKKKVKRVKL